MPKAYPQRAVAKATPADYALAEKMVARASQLIKSSDLDRALPIAREVLRLSPQFGGPALKDEEIQALLDGQGIGIETFKKALSLTRKSLVKKPNSRAPSSKSSRLDRHPVQTVQRSSEPRAGMVLNSDPRLL